jgi:hypothetical protein
VLVKRFTYIESFSYIHESAFGDFALVFSAHMPSFASVSERLSIPISAGFDILLEIASVLRDVSRLHVRLQAVLNTCILILEKEQQLVWI